MNKLTTATIHGMEILSAGKWFGKTGEVGFTAEDLDQLAEAFSNDPNFRPPVKLGHTKEQTLLDMEELPAAGYIRKVWREGDKLLADVSDVPVRLAELFKAGAWRNRSIEIDNLGATRERRVAGLALLGSAIPAVSNLADVEKLYHEFALEMPSGDDSQVIIFTSPERDPQELFASFDAAVDALEVRFGRGEGVPDLRALARGFQTGVTARRHEVDDTKIRVALGLSEDASEEDVLNAIAEAKKTPAAPAASGDTVELTRKVGELNGTVLTLQTELAKRDASAAVDALIREGKVVPAQREQSISFALSAPEAFQAFMKDAPVVVKFGETGTADGGQTAQFAATEAQIALARIVGNTPNDVEIQNYRDAGKDVPEALLAKQREEHPELVRK